MSDSFLATAVAATIALLFSTIVAFAGYRLFLVLLPIWGFVAGITVGAHAVQALFGDGFLSTTTSWIVGFFVGLIFAGLSYLYWVAAVAIISGSFAYSLVAATLGLIGLDLEFIAWLISMAVAILFAIGVLVTNFQKTVVIVATAFAGAAGVVMTFLFLLGGIDPATAAENPLQVALDDNPIWVVMLIVLGLLGVVGQMTTTRTYEVQRYDRMTEMAGA
jgi:hypothetical protein